MEGSDGHEHLVVNTDTDHLNPKLIISRLLGDKEHEWAAVAKTGSRNLLDLPVDVLKEIVRVVTHTNDLTSLARTHSVLHALATPQIYSRFDIVWPDGNTTIDSRTGVDALTYGLATLVMAKDVFGEGQNQRHSQNHIHSCTQCGRLDRCPHPAQATQRYRKTRRGNDYAQYTRKFSLGNGPADWVQEYLITKEGGKMLGTLVALAIGRMRNLETFIWDMPTGVLRDVWLALGSLADREDGCEPRLERVWVRWHDNSEATSSPANPTLTSHSAQIANHTAPHGLSESPYQMPAYPRVELPTFSILPPLKSLSVLDIDEVPYVDEMSILIERSLLRLRELRVGLAQHAQYDVWASSPEDKLHADSSITDNTPSSPRGLLDLLFRRLNVANSSVSTAQSRISEDADARCMNENASVPAPSSLADDVEHEGIESTGGVQDVGSSSSILDSMSAAKQTLDSSSTLTVNLDTKMRELTDSFNNKTTLDLSKNRPREASPQMPSRAPPKLNLEALELERVPLSIPVLSRSVDWSSLTSLTILGCPHYDQLWKALRRKFSTRRGSRTCSSPLKSPLRSPKTPSTPKTPLAPQDYQLQLKRLHTDSVSPTLIHFLKETLAPDTLEWLFLQENPSYSSTVTIDQIYRGPLRRHQESLKKLLITGDRLSGNDAPAGSLSLRSRRWTLNREVLSFILSGRMSSLRELTVTLFYKDWHFFLQRLPCIPHLRSLHVPHTVAANNPSRCIDPRELALQVLDVVALRPELELCYLGIMSKCFEILEYAAGNKPSRSDLASAPYGSGVGLDSDLDDSDLNNPTATAGNAQDYGNESDLVFDEDVGDNIDDDDDENSDDEDDAETSSTREDEDEDGDDYGNDHHHPFSSSPSSPSSSPSDADMHHGGNNIGGNSDQKRRRRRRGRRRRDTKGHAAAKVFKLREILFYDDKVAIFKARHRKL